ncbi:MAG TPA: M20/M25/M40 family metallo-hydrolase [Gryllotalpicola sp.]
MSALQLPTTEEVLAGLCEYVAIPSDSRNADAATMRAAAEWIAARLAFAGARLDETAGNPVVRADWLGAPGAPAVLVYGHYDVQPTGRLEEWPSPPYELTVDGESAYGRGASDDKGPVLIVVELLGALIAQRGALPLNVKILLEGEEEIGSPHLPDYVRTHAEELACDLVISADGAEWRPDEPSLSVASKGLVSFEITVTGASGDLHSGRYGGTVANPAQSLATILAGLHDADGRVAVAGFYDGVPELTPERRAAIRAVPFDDAAYAARLGVPVLTGEAGLSTLERLWERPTLEVNGIASGGGYTVIPHHAVGHVSCRLVGAQDPQRVLAAVRARVAELAGPGVTASVVQTGGAVPAYRMPDDHPALAAAAAALAAVYPGREVLHAVIAGTLPAATLFEGALGAKTLFFSFAYADEKAHAPGEFLRLRRIPEGMRAWQVLLESLAAGPHRLAPVTPPWKENAR